MPPDLKDLIKPETEPEKLPPDLFYLTTTKIGLEHLRGDELVRLFSLSFRIYTEFQDKVFKKKKLYVRIFKKWKVMPALYTFDLGLY